MAWDLPLIEYVRKELIEAPLSYYGFPGAEWEDIDDWKHCIGRVVAIDRENDLVRLTKHYHSARRLGVDKTGFALIHADFDEFAGIDSLTAKFQLDRWYELVNLDYEGGGIYKALAGISRRTKAWRDLFRNRCAIAEKVLSTMAQKGQRTFTSFERPSFIFMITLNVRSDDWGELERFCDALARKHSHPGLRSADERTGKNRAAQKWLLKSYFVDSVINLATEHRFYVYVFPVVSYCSGDSHLVHFVFFLNFSATDLRPLPIVPRDEALELPLGEVHGEAIVPILPGHRSNPHAAKPFSISTYLEDLRSWVDKSAEKTAVPARKS